MAAGDPWSQYPWPIVSRVDLPFILSTQPQPQYLSGGWVCPRHPDRGLSPVLTECPQCVREATLDEAPAVTDTRGNTYAYPRAGALCCRDEADDDEDGPRDCLQARCSH